MLALFDLASSTGKPDLYQEALALSERALRTVDDDPTFYFTKGGIHFQIGRWLPSDSEEMQERRIAHFRKVIELGDVGTSTMAYSWYNMSGAFLSLKRCKEAKTAAENALTIMDFKYARTHVAKAKRCIARNDRIYAVWLSIEDWINRLRGAPTTCENLEC